MSTRLGRSAIATGILAASCVLVSDPAGAAERSLSFEVELPLRATDWTDSVTVPRFDPALGELRSIDVRLETRMEGTVAVENLTASDASLVSTLSSAVTVQRPGPGLAIASLSPSKTRTDNLSSFDGTVDHGGSSGKTSSLNESAITTVTLLTPTDLALFTGLTPVTLPTSARGTSTGPSAPDASAVLTTTASAKVKVTYTYLTDTRAPDPPVITAGPPSVTSNATVGFEFTGEAGAHLECLLDAPSGPGTWGTCTSPWTTTLGLGDDGLSTFSVRATDAAGNVSDPTTRSFTLDRVAPPAPTFTSTPLPLSQNPRPVWAFTTEVGATARCTLDGGPQTPCASPFSPDLTAAPDGPHTLAVVAVDAAANTSPPAVHTYVLDRAAPAPPTLTTGPATPANDPTPTWGFALAPDAVTATCSLDGGPFTACTSPFTANLSAAADGLHTIAFRNADGAGNQSAATSSTYTLDRAAPAAPVITSPPSPSSDRSPSWGITVEHGASTECRLDGADWLPCFGSYSAAFGPDTDGVHVVAARATDAAGNLGPEATATYTLDTTAPPAPVITSAPANPSNSAVPTWSFTAETLATTTCSVDGGPWTLCTSPLTVDLGAAPDGPHSLAVRATDAVGNQGPSTTSTFVAGPGRPLGAGHHRSPGLPRAGGIRQLDVHHPRREHHPVPGGQRSVPPLRRDLRGLVEQRWRLRVPGGGPRRCRQPERRRRLCLPAGSGGPGTAPDHRVARHADQHHHTTVDLHVGEPGRGRVQPRRRPMGALQRHLQRRPVRGGRRTAHARHPGHGPGRQRESGHDRPPSCWIARRPAARSSPPPPRPLAPMPHRPGPSPSTQTPERSAVSMTGHGATAPRR